MCQREQEHLSWLEQASAHIMKQGSQRKKIWDLTRDTHCPIVGVCIPLIVLRKLVSKGVGELVIADDYEIHVGAISECANRNKLSELIQADLDQRYAKVIKEFRSAKTPQALTSHWLHAINQGDVAGAFWAGLTHPQCDPPLQEGMCRDMHMLQHQAGACVRADIHRFNQLIEENKIISRELARMQERSTRLIQEKTCEVEKLNEQLMQQRAENIRKDSVISYLNENIESIKKDTSQLASRQKLQEKIKQMGVHQTRLEKIIRELRADQTQYISEQIKEAKTQLNLQLNQQQAELKEENRVFPIKLYLEKKNVLCVGGRSSSVPTYRDLIEKVGGKFAHHDGGIEDNQSLLEASLVAADLVICQTACISHNAYWRVKEFCKRTGKRCVFVENPSASSLARSLELVSKAVEV